MVDIKWFDTLYTENYERLKKIACRSLGSEAIAEEIVQEAFLILLCKHDEVKRHPNSAGWLVITVQNLIKNELTRASTRREVAMTEEPMDQRFMTNEKLEDILPAELPAEEREILILYFDHQISHKEIAAKMEISEGACRTRLYRAKEHVKNLFLKNEKSCDKTGAWTNTWVRR